MSDTSSTTSMGTRAGRGAVWSVVGFGASQIVRLAGNLVMTRLLFAEAFGLMALVGSVLQGLQLFSDIGIRPSIVQNRRGDDREFLNTAWTAQVGRGLILWCVALIIAEPLAEFYGAPELAPMLRVVGLVAVMNGFNCTKLYTAGRHLAIGRLTVLELLVQCFSLAVSVTWAWLAPSVWALVAAGVSGAAIRMVLTYTMFPGPGNRFAWSRPAVQDLFKFGRWIFLSTALTFLVSHSDRLIFGRMIPLGFLGIYSIALLLSQVPQKVVERLSTSIAFPVFSRAINSGADLSRAFGKVRDPMLLLGGWVSSGFIAGGDTIVRLLYDDRYMDAGWILQVLMMGSWVTMLESSNTAGLLAKGRSSLVAACSSVKLAGMLVLIPAGFAAAEFPGALLGYIGAEFLRFIASVAAARHCDLRDQRRDVRLSMMVLVASVAGYLAAVGVRDLGAHPVFEAVVVFVAVSLLWAPLLSVPIRRVRAGGVNQLFEFEDV